MKLHYYRETDSLYIDLSKSSSVDSREVAPGVVADLDADGRLVGIVIEHASVIADLTRIDTESLPMRSDIIRDE